MAQTPESKSTTSDWMDGSSIASRHSLTTTQSSQTRKARSKVSLSLASAEVSLEDFSDHDEFAFLASMRAQRLHDFIYNNNDCSKESRERLSTLSDLSNALVKEQTLNKASWEVIDREIREWQRVCSSGRPSWWSSPVAKRSRLHQTYVSYTEDSLAQGDETKRRLLPFEEPCNKFRRVRALSESSLPNTTKLDDLAHLIAIQLLSACFTLPPEHVPESAPSSYHYYDTRADDLPDPKLISALRMHTHFRYSPGFGHDARNNSIANSWAHVNDGRCTPNLLASIQFAPFIRQAESRPKKSKRRVRRALNTTEASMIDQDDPLCPLDGQHDDHKRSIDNSDIPPSATATAWNRRKGVRDSNGQEMSLPAHEQKRINISLSPSERPKTPPDKSIYTHRDHQRKSSRSGKSHSKKDHEQDSEDAGSTSRSLESQIRSEPHPVFIQPVKDLVVKRWRTFRSHFGQHNQSPDPSSTSNDFLAESENGSTGHAQYVGSLRLQSPPGMFAPASSTNNDGKERRRRARKDSEINSGSSDDTPKNNTPMSENGGMADGLVAAMDVGRASPTIHLLDPLTATPASEASSFLSPPSSASIRSSTFTSPAPSPLTSPNPRSQSVAVHSPRGGPPPAITRGSRRKRKSMLSEMHTPDTYHGLDIEMSPISAVRPPLSIAGSAIPSPSDSIRRVTSPSGSIRRKRPASYETSPLLTPSLIPFDLATPGPAAATAEDTYFDETPGSVFVDWSAGNVEELAVQKVMENDLAMERAALLERESVSKAIVSQAGSMRPRMVRVSTSGTQRFTPNADGVEVDGLPVGPGLEEAGWNVEQKGKDKGKVRESSFL